MVGQWWLKGWAVAAQCWGCGSSMVEQWQLNVGAMAAQWWGISE